MDRRKRMTVTERLEALRQVTPKEVVPTLKIELYTPHSGQVQMHTSKARFRIACCGRRFGKTLMGTNELVKFANENKGVITTWVAPTYRQARLAFTLIVNNFSGAFRHHTKNPLEIYWMSGSVTKFLSTESGDNLRGDNSHMMVIDEAAMIEDNIWSDILRPMLADTNGKAIIISTPKSLNWFYRLYTRGEDPLYPDYQSFTFPTSANPYIRSSEIEEVRQSLPEDVFRQEFLAEFLEGSGTVFRNIYECIKADEDVGNKVLPGRQYVIGFDIAKHQDYSVIIVLDAVTNHLVHFDRFNRIDYSVQVQRVADIAQTYNNAKIIVDSTGLGDPILENIKKMGLDAEGYLFTNRSKQQLIEHLAVQLERGDVTYPDIKVLINELLAYEYEISRAGNMKYNAPNGQHDDCVIALALASWGVVHGKSPRILTL